ncbi:MAG: ZIP family metal transporter [Calditrichaeota bacterium]|nr:ZIP family metal transporter [Calditrichota bacterium]
MSTLALAWITGLVFLAAAVGGLLPMVWHEREEVLRLFVSFGAGVLLATAFLHMIPEAAELAGNALGPGILAGFLTLYVTEKFVMTHPCEAEHCDYHRIGWSALAGLSFHSFVDGVAIGSSALVPRMGPVVALAILFHKLPASMALSSVLLHSGFTPARTELAVLVFGAMVPLGAFVTHALLGGFPAWTLGFLIAFSAGTFIHIATDDLMPEIHRKEVGRFRNLFSFVVGLGVVAAGRLFTG